MRRVDLLASSAHYPANNAIVNAPYDAECKRERMHGDKIEGKMEDRIVIQNAEREVPGLLCIVSSYVWFGYRSSARIATSRVHVCVNRWIMKIAG